ncbi:MAG: hypothetical protein VW576_02220 [Opitutae bacterium]
MSKKSGLQNRSEHPGNLVSIEAHDHTSRAYRKESNPRPEIGFGAYLTIAALVFLVILFAGIYELVVETWTRLK